MNNDGNCAWGRKIKTEFAAQPTPLMPAGWTRVFEEHWGCTPAFEYFVPGTSSEHPDRAKDHYRSTPIFQLTIRGIEKKEYMRRMFGYVDQEDLDAVMLIVRRDQKWLKDFDRRHGLECTHGAEEDAASTEVTP